MSLFINYLFKKLDIKIKTVSLYNHQSLHAEHRITSLSTILMKPLTNLTQNVVKISAIGYICL